MSASPEIRTVQVIYGYLQEKISRKESERFITLHAAESGLSVPQPPIARYWCRPSHEDAPLSWMIGWTAPMHFPSDVTHDAPARGAALD